MASDPDFPSAAETSVIYWLSRIVTLVVGVGALIWSSAKKRFLSDFSENGAPLPPAKFAKT